MTEAVQIQGGPVYDLYPPHTVESIKDDASYSKPRPAPFWCRLRHRWRRVGEPHIDETDLTGAVMNLIATDYDRYLIRCKRCRRISLEPRKY